MLSILGCQAKSTPGVEKIDYGKIIIVEEKMNERLRNLSPDTVETAVFAPLVERPNRFCTWEEIADSVRQAGLGEIKPSHIRTQLSNIRAKLQDNGFIYTIEFANGAFFSLSELKTASLRALGISLFREGKNGGKAVDQLSVLSAQVYENPLIENPLVIFELMDRLVLRKKGKGASFFSPYLSPLLRRLLACLAEGGLRSAKKLIKAANISPLDEPLFHDYLTLRRELTNLRKKITPVDKETNATKKPEEQRELTIFTREGYGHLLAQRQPGASFIYSPAVDVEEAIEKMEYALYAEPKEVNLSNIYLEKGIYARESLALLSLLLKHPHRYFSFEDLYEKILFPGERFYPTYQKRFKQYLFIARKALKEFLARVGLKENWHIATIPYQRLILCQGNIGEEINLPDLYDFSKISDKTVRQSLSDLMAKGRIKTTSEVSPRFTPTEAGILLILGKTPNQFLDIESLEKELWGHHLYEIGPGVIKTNISVIRKKFEKLRANVRIEREANAYQLVFC